jgi:tetratricopeptide (TPR) repeat protein
MDREIRLRSLIRKGAMTDAHVRASPEPIEQALKPVIAAIRSGNLAEAIRLARGALDRGLEHPMLLNLRAMDYEDAGLFKQALTDLRRAHLLAPQDFAILNACGLCLARMARFEEALNCYDQALAIRPDFGPAWFNRGWALERVGEKHKAGIAYQKSVELNPDNVPALASLAFLLASRGDARGARTNAGRALELQPSLATAVLALALAEMDEPAKAEGRLRNLLTTELSAYDRGLAYGLLGDALDAQDRAIEAFSAYAESNAELRKDVAPRFVTAGQPTIAASVLWLNRWAESLDPRSWRSAAHPGSGPYGERAHVFLLGFPRSGTTLLESVLDQHPDTVTLEERDTLHRGVLAYLSDPGDLARLAEAPEAALKPLRDDYWARVAGLGVDVKGKVFIDKNPFNTLKLPVILKLFPGARILFAVRDPRDVVLSCFRRRFNINPSTYEFLDLAATAASYNGLMQLAATLREKLPITEHQVVYERLVETFESEARAACDFIGVDWRSDLLEFADRAGRGEIASASAAQIARGLYTEGAGQWRRYRAQLDSVLPSLSRWVAYFGYQSN